MRRIMPSEMVPAQQLSELSDDMVRLLAIRDNEIAYRDAEIATLTEQRDEARAAEADITKGFKTVERECREWHRRCNAITEQRDALNASCRERLQAFLQEHEKVKALTEQRDRLQAALQPFADAATDLDDKTKDVSEIWELPVAMSIIAGDLRRARDVHAALDAEAETEGRRYASVPYLDDAIARLMQKDHASVFALADIATERVRQIEKEGWTTAHDDAHPSGELSTAGAAYALSWHTPRDSVNPPPAFWPWHRDWWKPRSKHSNCIRAGALIVAELARHLRSAPAEAAAEKET